MAVLSDAVEPGAEPIYAGEERLDHSGSRGADVIQPPARLCATDSARYDRCKRATREHSTGHERCAEIVRTFASEPCRSDYAQLLMGRMAFPGSKKLFG